MNRRGRWLQFAVAISLAGGGCRQPVPDAARNPLIDRYLQRAQALADQDRLTEAVAEADKAVRVAPDDFAALVGLGTMLRRAGVVANAGRDDTRGWYRRSRETLERALELEPNREEPRIELAQLLADSQQLANAASLLAPFAATGSPRIRFHLASLTAAQGDHQRAVEIYRAGLDAAPDDISAHLACGHSLVQLGDLAAAKTEFARALVLDPTQSESFLQLGLTLGRLDEAEWSVVALARAADLDPSLEKAHYSLAMAMRRLGRDRAAVFPQERFDRLRADDERATALTEALGKNPDDQRLRSELAELYLRRGMTTRARASAEIVVDHGPPDARAHRVLAAVHRLNRLPAQALLEINLAIGIDPDDVASLEERANLHFEAGRLLEAQADLQRILSLDRMSGPVLELLARVALRAGRPETALAIRERSLGQQPPIRYPRLFLVTAEALLRVHRLQEASQMLLAYLESQPADPAAIQHLIELAKAAGDPTRARSFEQRLKFVLSGELPAGRS